MAKYFRVFSHVVLCVFPVVRERLCRNVFNVFCQGKKTTRATTFVATLKLMIVIQLVLMPAWQCACTDPISGWRPCSCG